MKTAICDTIAETKIMADRETCFQESSSEFLLLLLWDRPRLELIIVSSTFQALLFLQSNYWDRSESDQFQ